MLNRKSSAKKVGAGMAAGVALGLAAGLFLQSKKGKVIEKDLEKKAMALQKQVMKHVREAEYMTEAGYEKLVDQLSASYVKSKDIAAKELPLVKKQLMKRWKAIKAMMEAERS